MKTQKLLLTLIGGWILFIGLDSTSGRVGTLGVRSLQKPLQLAYFVIKTVRTIVLFLLAASTFLLVVQKEKKVTEQG